MKMKTKIAIIIALVLAALGLAAIVGALIAMQFNIDYRELNTMKYTETIHEITEDFDKICIDTESADIRFVLSSSGNITVTTEDSDKLKNEVSVTNGTLTIKSRDTRKWYDHIGLYVTAPKITVSIPTDRLYSALTVKQTTGSADIPKGFTFGEITVNKTTGTTSCNAVSSGKVDITCTTGSVKLNELSAKALHVKVTTGSTTINSADIENNLDVESSTGSVRLSDVKCNTFSLSATTGSVTLSRFSAASSIKITSTTGSVHLEHCAASPVMSIVTTTGSVSGSISGNVNISASTTVGSISIPENIDDSSAICSITTTTGSIKITRD